MSSSCQSSFGDLPSLSVGSSIIVTGLCAVCVIFTVVFGVIFIFRSLSHAEDIGTQAKFFVNLTIIFCVVTNISCAMQDTIVACCPNWFYLQFDGSYSSVGTSLLSSLVSIVNIGYNSALLMIYFVFYYRVILAFHNSPYAVSIQTKVLFFASSIIQLSLFCTVIFLFQLQISDPSYQYAAYLCNATLLLFYLFCCFALFCLFLRKIYSISIEFIRLNKKANDKVKPNANSASASACASSVANTEFEVCQRYLTMMTRTSVLVLGALTSSLVAVLLILLSTFLPYQVERSFYLYVAIATAVTFDSAINMVCLALQLHYNHIFYQKYCKVCDKWFQKIFMRRLQKLASNETQTDYDVEKVHAKPVIEMEVTNRSEFTETLEPENVPGAIQSENQRVRSASVSFA